MTDVATQERFTWTAERVDLLRKLWKRGDPLSSIAREIGPCVTEGMITGKIHRLGLSGRTKLSSVFIKPAPPPRLPPLKITPTPSKPLRLPGLHAFDPGNRRTVSILALRTGMCRWPYGERPIRYCGDPTTDPTNPECPYCATHKEIARASRTAESDAA